MEKLQTIQKPIKDDKSHMVDDIILDNSKKVKFKKVIFVKNLIA